MQYYTMKKISFEFSLKYIYIYINLTITNIIEIY